MSMKKFLLFAILLSAIATAHALTPELDRQIEEIARQIADRVNARHSPNTRAESHGSNVTFVRYTRSAVQSHEVGEQVNLALAVEERNLAVEERILYDVCTSNRDNPAFMRGLSYTFSYRAPDESQVLSVYVDLARCYEKRLFR